MGVASGRTPALKGTLNIDVFRGKIRVRAWPSKRGTPKSEVVRQNNLKFKMANLLTKYLAAREQQVCREATHRTPLLPRDVMLMGMYGRFAYIVFQDGRRLYTMSMRSDVSESLDVITATPGQILIRGADWWEGTDLPSGGGGSAVLMKPDLRLDTGVNFGANAFALCGTVPDEAQSISGIALGVKAGVAGHVATAVIYQANAAGNPTNLVAQSTVPVALANQSIVRIPFDAPVGVVADQQLWIGFWLGGPGTVQLMATSIGRPVRWGGNPTAVMPAILGASNSAPAAANHPCWTW